MKRIICAVFVAILAVQFFPMPLWAQPSTKGAELTPTSAAMVRFDDAMSLFKSSDPQPIIIEGCTVTLIDQFIKYQYEQEQHPEKAVKIARTCVAVFAERLEKLSVNLQYFSGSERQTLSSELLTVYQYYTKVIEPGIRADVD
ncbi:hypothetical protein ACFL04_04025 [Patescibacteria group bacterium]